MASDIDVRSAINFHDKVSFKSGNTSILVDGNITTMYLHNNPIARLEGGNLFICNGGYSSKTTNARLDAVLDYAPNGLCAVFSKIQKKQIVLRWRNKDDITHILDSEWLLINELVDEFIERENEQ